MKRKKAMSGGLKKKVLSHLKEDSKDFRGQIKDDVKLKAAVKKGKC